MILLLRIVQINYIKILNLKHIFKTFTLTVYMSRETIDSDQAEVVRDDDRRSEAPGAARERVHALSTWMVLGSVPQ